MEGWLTKRRDHMNIIWTERYFILEGSNLRYYKKRGDPTPRGTYVLTNECVVGKVFNSEEKHKHHDQVWMFRITFSVGAGEKSYKKDRFIDLGAKDEKMAEAWKKALEQTISAIKEVAGVKEEILKGADVGKGYSATILDTDNVSLFNLDTDNVKTEQGWWLVRVEEGLRIMQECPLGHQVAASMYAHHANLTNNLLFASTISAVLAFSVMHSMVANMLVCFGTAFAAVVVCAVTLMPKATIEIPSLRVSQVVHGPPSDVFRLIMNTSRYQRWDSSVTSVKVVQAMDDHSDIIYVQLRPVYIWPMWQKPRDLVLMRYWRREEDGSYFVMYQSTTHPECRVRHNFVRASILGGGYVIAPQKSSIHGGVRSLVTYVLRYDPKGNSSIYHQLGMDVDAVLPMLRSVVGMRDELSGGDFITPSVTVADSSSENSRVDGGGIGGAAPHVVQKLKTSLPEKMWSEPDASRFAVRGPNYLVDKKKSPSKKARFRLVGVDLFAFDNEKERYNLANRPGSHVQTAPGFTFIINMIIPSPNNLSMVFYFQPDSPTLLDENSPFSDLLADFLDGDDAFRNSRFKLIPTVVEGTFIVKQAVGSVPTLLGNKLSCPYHRGPNYFEVDIDISSNSVANTVVGMVKGVTKVLVVDLAFLLESQSEEELPEAILGTVRLQNVSLDNPLRVPALQT